jgi:hypothetical protein
MMVKSSLLRHELRPGQLGEVIGEFRILKAGQRTHKTFFDYIHDGCNINLHIAIDFTLTNGQPQDRKSRHYLGEPGDLTYFNDYQKTIHSVGQILLQYDSDQKVGTLIR